jgi:sigma-B regulation protein RsbU (phosphoserine phosphatase)
MKTVLIVDDVEMNRKIVRTILSKRVQNIEIVEAEDGFEAMDIIRSREISVVILDIMMPGKDGIEVLTEIKALPEYKNVPIIMCSALDDNVSIENALTLGALDYFTKPLMGEQIRITLPIKVKNALEYYEQKKELIKFYDHIKDEMILANHLQNSLISEYSVFNNAAMWGRYIPCEEVGGDMFCCKEVMNKLWFMMADVSGHGIASAMLSAMLSVIFNTSLSSCNSPGDMLKSLNKTLFEVFRGSNYGLVSAFVGCIDKNTLQYSNAGHPYPLFFRKTANAIEELAVNGLLLGVFEDESFDTAIKDIAEGDAIILYTDGIFDKGKDSEYANWSVVRDFCEYNLESFSEDISNFMDKIIEYFKMRGNCNFIDDVAIMIVRKSESLDL